MRSMKLLVAMALVTALVAGPVLAQDATGGTPSSTTSADTTMKKHPKKHTAKKHRAKKSTSGTTAPAPEATPSK